MIARRVAIAVGFGLLIAGAIVGKVADRGTSGGTAGRTIRLVAPNGVRFVNSAVGWVTDDHGQRLLMTSDGGGSWVNISPPILGRPRDPPQLVLAGALFESRSSFWVAVFRYRGGWLRSSRFTRLMTDGRGPMRGRSRATTATGGRFRSPRAARRYTEATPSHRGTSMRKTGSSRPISAAGPGVEVRSTPPRPPV